LDVVLKTERLTLRPAREGDAGRFVEILSNWNVIRMVRLAPHPYTVEHARAWILSHAQEREAGAAHRFVVERQGAMIGACDVDEIEGVRCDLGYWLDEDVWGQGFATEAARAVIALSFGPLGLSRLTSGHAADNIKSGRVLAKLGFQASGETRVWSSPRGGWIDQLKYELRSP
jgi:RimJ/RimL family protein N-acetyltransferase